MRCAKFICEQHGHLTGTELLCTACARTAAAESNSESDADDSTLDDPYLYSSYHYNGYGYYGRGPWQHGEAGPDPDDFTEADGESLRGEASADFEQDMGGS
jgi:hypothetical protein